jgi:hypothetical protein
MRTFTTEGTGGHGKSSADLGSVMHLTFIPLSF